MPNNFIVIWQYRVKPEKAQEFLEAYGPDGEWVRLFHESPGYIGTELLCDSDNQHTFVTIDRWESARAF